jgi:hypothetical protein
VGEGDLSLKWDPRPSQLVQEARAAILTVIVPSTWTALARIPNDLANDHKS